MPKQPEWWFMNPIGPGTVPAARQPLYQLSDEMLFPAEVEIIAIPSDHAHWPGVRMRFEVEHGRPVCTQLSFERVAPSGEPPGPEITAAAIASVAVEAVTAKALAWQAAQLRQYVKYSAMVADGGSYTVDEDGTISFALSPEEKRATEESALALHRQRTIGAGHLSDVAKIYLADPTGKPTEAVKDHFHTSKRTATRWVQLARDRGLLPAYERRTTGGREG